MTRTFLKNLFWLQALNWLIKPIWILWIERTVQIQLGNEWYGKYFVHFNLGLLFAVLLDAGLNAYVSREVASEGRLVNKNRVLGLRLIFGAIYVLLVYVFAHVQGLDTRIIGLVIINQIMASMVLLIRAVLQGRQLFVSDAILSVLDRLVAILLSAWFLFGSHAFEAFHGITVFLGAQTAGYTLALLFGFYLLRFRGSFVTPQPIELQDDINLKQWTKTIVWYMAMALFMSVFTRIDALMIRNFSPSMFGYNGVESGYFQAGLYAQSYRLLDAGLIFSTLLSTQLLPIFSKNLKEGNTNQPIIWLAFRLVWFVGIMALFTVAFFGKMVLELLYGAKWEGGTDAPWAHSSFFILVLLMGAFMAMSSIHVFGTFITAQGRIKSLALLSFLVMVLNITLNRIGVPRLGAEGAAWSALISQWVFAISCVVLAVYRHRFQLKNIKWKTIPMSLVYLGILFLATFNVPELPQKRYILMVAWILGIAGVLWMLFGQDLKKWRLGISV